MKIERELPHDLGAEDAILGGIIIDNDAIHEVPGLEGKHFYSTGNGRVFDAMRQMALEGVPIDYVTLPERLTAAGMEHDLGQLVGLMNVVPTSVNVSKYADIVTRKAYRRDLIRVAGELAGTALSDSNDIEEVRSFVSGALLGLIGVDGRDDDESIKRVASSALDRVMALKAMGGKMQGISSGYDGVDEIVRGLQPGRLYLLGGRPGMGKTAMATNMAERMARAGKHVLFFSLEMSEEQLVYRMAAQISGCSYSDVSEGRLTDDEMLRVANALGELSEMNITIVNGARTPGEVYSKTMRAMAMGGVDAVFIDYVQLMRTDKPAGNRNLEVGAISTALKDMSLSLGIPVILLVQLNRAVESRGDRHPVLTDLRDSGQLEQDGDVVIFLYRSAYYLNDEDIEEGDVLPPEGQTEFIVAKNRFGPTGVAEIYFDAESGCFHSGLTWQTKL